MGTYKFTVYECGGRELQIKVDRPLGGHEDVRAAAIEIARTIMATEIGQGRLCLTCWIVVTNEHGHNIFTLQFGDAIEVVEHASCAGLPAGV